MSGEAARLVLDDAYGLLECLSLAVVELNKNSPNNWLDDGIWLKKAYHEWRAPLIVNSNWWLALGDDYVIPPSVRFPASTVDHCTPWQIRRAAWLAHRVLDFKTRLERLVFQ